MQKEENQETAKVFEDNLDKEKVLQDDNLDAKQKEASLESRAAMKSRSKPKWKKTSPAKKLQWR